MKSKLSILKMALKQNLDLIHDFQEIITLEEKSVAEDNTEPIDIEYFKKFNTIQCAALETCMELLEKHEPKLQEMEKAKQAENSANKSIAKPKVTSSPTRTKPEKQESSKPIKKDIDIAMDLFAAFDEDEGKNNEETT